MLKVAAVQTVKVAMADSNRIVSIRSVKQSKAAGGRNIVEIEVMSSRPFPVGGSLPVLDIGGQDFSLSRFANGGTDRLIFTLEAAEFAALRNRAKVSVKIGGAPAWDMGLLRKP